jgi:hypothetical protein
MQAHEYTHGSGAEATGRYFVRLDRCHTIQTDYWIANVPDEHQTKHLFCREHLLSVSSRTGHVHLVAAKHVMRYLKGTLDCGLSYEGDHNFTLSGYTDSDWAGSVADKKSTSGCCFSLGLAMISWQSRKQSSIALSTAEAEYIAACSASCEAIWLRKLLTGLFDLEMEATTILCDNQSCIKMTENPVFHDRSKHIEIRYHYIRDMV